MEEITIKVYSDYLQMLDFSHVKILSSMMLDEDIERDKAIMLFLEVVRQQIYALLVKAR